MKDPIITDTQRYRQLYSQADKLVLLGRRLPSLIFGPRIDSCIAFEFGMTRQRRFLPWLVALACSARDSDVNYMSIEPHPERDFFLDLKYYGMAVFSRRSLADDYSKVAMSNASPCSNLMDAADVSILWGSSESWAIYCDRKSWELCVLGFDRSILAVPKMPDQFDMKILSTYIKDQYARRPWVAERFLCEFEANYGDLIARADS